MSSEWKTYTVQELIDAGMLDEPLDGNHGSIHPKASDYVSAGVPFIMANNLVNGKVDYANCAYITEAQASTLRKGFAKPGDVLLTHKATIGRTAIVSDEYDTIILTPQVTYYRVKKGISNRYLKYYFDSSTFQQLFANWAGSGSTRAYLGITAQRKLPIVLPPYEVQLKIAKCCGVLDDKIYQNQRINDNLQQQAQALFKKWFVDNPDAISWKEGTFSDLIEKTISGDWGKDSPSGNNTEMVYCIRGADIPEVRAGNKGKMPTRYILPKNYAAKQLVDGDIVVEISGGSPTQSTGRAAAVSDTLLARYDKGMVCTNFCKALKPRAGYSMYVYYYWQYLYDRNIFFSYENGTTGIKNLDINGFIETEPIVIAPEDLVEKFDAVCQTVFSKIYANGMENEQLALVRDTILPKLMSGEIDVSAVQL